jgi:apolipoprotein N-acyltransferase
MTAAALGLLSAIGFAPIGWWPVTLACLALLIAHVQAAPSLKAALARGYWFGWGHFVVGLNWIAGSFRYQHEMPVWLGWVAVVVLSFYLAVYPATTAGLAWRWGRGKPIVFVLFFAAAWIVTEWLRATLFTGFAWNPLSATLADFTFVAGVSRTIGTYGLSGYLLLIAGGIAVYASRWAKGIGQHWSDGTWLSWALLPLFLALAAIFIVTGQLGSGFGQNEARSYAKASGPLIRIVQPNIGQQDKHVAAFDAINFAKLTKLTGKPGTEPRLILWPEAATPNFLEEEIWAREQIAALMGPKDVIITGGVAMVYNKQDLLVAARNSAFAMTADAKLIGRYDKSHLVPYGEYLPMRPLLSAIGLSRLVPGDLDFMPGPGPQSIALPGFGKAGLQICYEIVFSGEVVDKANRPNFLFNPSNDAWFGAWGPPQHLAQARLRAMEEGLPIVRSTPTGISAVIDADGQILHALPYQQAGFIAARLPAPHKPTLFARYGNILPFLFALLLTLFGVAQRRKPR